MLALERTPGLHPIIARRIVAPFAGEPVSKANAHDMIETRVVVGQSFAKRTQSSCADAQGLLEFSRTRSIHVGRTSTFAVVLEALAVNPLSAISRKLSSTPKSC